MLIKLTKYELLKKWKASRYFLIGYLFLAFVLILLMKLYLWNNNLSEIINQNSGQQLSFLFVCSVILFFTATLILSMYPFFESIYRFERDLSGKQSVLELMIPIISWKKILSKLIATICAAIVCLTLVGFSIFAAVFIIGNFNQSVINLILNHLSLNQFKSIVAVGYLTFLILEIYMLFFFCIATSKSFSHKKRFAVPIGIGVFILSVVIIGNIGLQMEKIPIHTYHILGINYSLSSLFFDILMFIGLLMGTSWLMEKRIEH
ncbi:hypothetical protein Sgly_1807 [Syntrophobotulus glycolicus DSM 8271]|uniref:Uncharacterized protein n=1 Tax=Syntrophobotulus glycolicus (strain DSM 8271 / FlGlyR) TaxID=645991 RepID=F0SZL8_SYNGF|nr:hypothetical protein [Syntrophobotulus glycolicus]ADY56104.1 hypothetical protein Sgly_1807 [Syntrophobotulus glycolicus DSM 8271]